MNFTSIPKVQMTVIEGRYEVRSDGRIFSLTWGGKPSRKPREMFGTVHADGNVYVNIKDAYGARSVKLCRIVAEVFLPKVLGKDFVKHKDGNKRNNNVDNLEWVEYVDAIDYDAYVEKKQYYSYIVSKNGYPIAIFNTYGEIAERYVVPNPSITKAIKQNKLLIKLYHVWKLPKGDERIADVRKLLDRCEEERQQRALQGVQRIAPRIMHK